MKEAADTKKSKRGKPTLDREEFVNFYHNLTERSEIKELYGLYSCNKGYLTPKDLLTFFVEEQKEENMTETNCTELIFVYEPQKENKELERMSFIGFRHLLISPTQHLFMWRHRRVYQDMTQPMTNYFISSSHNTYLAEDQLKGPSRVECYITALKKGCRCVELDCYDGSNGEPVIYHGYTLTSKILFRDIITAIRDYAFVASPYPVILSIENHCSKEQQEVMANILMRTFGKSLYAPDVLPSSPPSPHELKEKIIVKGKKLPFNLRQSNILERGSSVDEGEVSDEDEALEVPSELQQRQQEEVKHHQKLDVKFSQSIGMKSVTFKGCDQPPTGSENFNVVSLAEKKIEKLLENDPEGICNYARSTLIRTYPAGSRTDSSNYNPVPMWCGGCQIVALNFQTGGLEMQLLHGKFADNGNCGYILKPNCLRTDEAYQVVLGRGQSPTRMCLNIEVISGFQLPKPKNSKKGEVIDPFLKIDIFGAAIDTQDRKTAVIKNNGFNPIWKEKFKFRIEVPELALIRFAVYDKDQYFDDFIGFYVLPINSLQQGKDVL
ncbi:hypothetical protein ACJMK2_019882 [Sinanodonta woodiana]|uniref:Phosphoinositide phospholipase C n=1 Tax=Sinanodonta woodiana TaxID=1069815 RepID=A0ABD3TYM3_SINWO